LSECLIIHHEGHEGAQRLEKTRKNLRGSVQSVAESCQSEHVKRVSTQFQNALLGRRWQSVTNRVVQDGTAIAPDAARYPSSDMSTTKPNRMPNTQFNQRFSGLFTQ